MSDESPTDGLIEAGSLEVTRYISADGGDRIAVSMPDGTSFLEAAGLLAFAQHVLPSYFDGIDEEDGS